MLPEEKRKRMLLTNLSARPIEQQAQGSGLPAFGAQPMVERGLVDTSEGLPSENVYRQAEQAYNRSVLPQPAPILPRPAQAMQPERTVLGTVGDIGVTGLRAAIGLPEAIQGLADIPTGGRVGKFTEDYLDYKPGEAKHELSKMYSPAQKYAQKQVSDAKGFLPTISASVSNPSTIATSIAESLPLMVGGGVVGGAIGKSLSAIPKLAPYVGKLAPYLGAVGEGAMAAGSSAEDFRQQSSDRLLGLKQATAAVGAGVGTAIFGAIGARVAKAMGIADVDTLLTGLASRTGVRETKDGIASRILKAGFTEGVLEEMPQSAQEQVWVNAAMDRPLMEGVEEAAGIGLVTGAAMGSGASIYSGRGVTDGSEGGTEQGVGETVEVGVEGEQAPRQPGVDQDLLDQTRHFLDTGQISPDTEQGARIKEHLSEIAANPEMADAVEANRDIFEAMGVIGKAPVEPAPKEGPTDQVGDQQEAGAAPDIAPDIESEGLAEEDGQLIRARAIQKNDRTAEEQGLVDQDDERVASEGLAIRRAQAIPEKHRTDGEREVVRAEESRVDEGGPKDREAQVTAGAKDVKEASAGLKTDQAADVRPEQQAFEDLGEGMTAAARADVAKSIVAGKTDRLELKRLEAVEAAVKSDDYNVRQNDDGSATIIGVKSGDAWTGEAPAGKQAIPKEASKQIKTEAEAAATEAPAHTSMTQAIKQGGINLGLAKAAGWDVDSLKDIRRPGLFSETSGVSPDEMAQTLGYESEEAMKNEWVKAPTRKELVSSAKTEGEEQYRGLDESVKTLEKEGFDLGSEEKVSVGELSPGDEVVVADSRGVPGKLIHEGFTPDGNAILKDGQRIEADPFEELNILAKKTGDTDTAARAQQMFGDILQTESAAEIRAAIKNLPAKVKADQGLKPYSDLIEASLNRRLAEVTTKKTAAKAPSKKTLIPEGLKQAQKIQRFVAIGQMLNSLPLEIKRKIARDTKEAHSDFFKLLPSIKDRIDALEAGMEVDQHLTEYEKHGLDFVGLVGEYAPEHKEVFDQNIDEVHKLALAPPKFRTPFMKKLKGYFESVTESGKKPPTPPIKAEADQVQYPNKRSVETALRRGEDVPASVMRQYPELSPASPEQIAKKEGVSKRLGSVMREESKGTAGARRELGEYLSDPKKFHEERREPGRLRTLTESDEYRSSLPKNTERIISKAADIKRKLLDAGESVKDSKEQLVRFFKRAGVDKLTITHNGIEYTVKKPIAGESDVLTAEGEDAKQELYKDYQESGNLKFVADRGVILAIQPKHTAVSAAAPYATKTFNEAAHEHIDLIARLAEASELELIIKAKFLKEIAPKLRNGGMDHVFRNTEGNTAFNIRRRNRLDFLIHPEDAAEFERIKSLRDTAFLDGDTDTVKDREAELKKLVDPAIKAELAAKIKKLRKAPVTGRKHQEPLGPAGVAPQAARGFKGKGSQKLAANAKLAVREELDQILKSVAGIPLPKNQQADIRAELKKALGTVAAAQEKRGAFEIVTPERAAQALALIKGVKKSIAPVSDLHMSRQVDLFKKILVNGEALGIGDFKHKGTFEAFMDAFALTDGSVESVTDNLSETANANEDDIFYDESDTLAAKEAVSIIRKNKVSIPADAPSVPDEYEARARAKYGTTLDPSKASYVFSNGDMLDFSGGGQTRALPHYSVEDVIKPPVSNELDPNKVKPIHEFAKHTGAIRIDYKPSLGRIYINILAPPTKEQIRSLLDIVDLGVGVEIDYWTSDGKEKSVKGLRGLKAKQLIHQVSRESSTVEVKYSKDGQRLEGLAFKDGRVWLIQDNVEEGQAVAVLGHELGTHVRHLDFKDASAFKAILKRIEVLGKTDQEVRAAFDRVPVDTGLREGEKYEKLTGERKIEVDNLRNEEALAYLVSDAPQHSLVRRLWSALKRFLSQKTSWTWASIDKFSPADMQAMAQSAIRRVESGVTDRAATGVNEFAQSAKKSIAQAANATREGVTSTTSAEAGNKAISSMMEMIRKIGKETESGLYKSRANEQKFIDRYRKIKNNPAKTVQEGLALLSDFARQADVPPGTKARTGLLAKQITAVKRPGSQLKRLDSALVTLEQDISRRLKTKVRNQIKRAAGPKKEGAIKRGRFFHEYEADMQGINKAVHMDKGQVERAIDTENSRFDRAEALLKDAEPSKRANLLQQAVDAKVKLHHLETFGNLAGKSLDQLLRAKFQAEQIKKLGRSKLRAAKTAWQAEMDKKTDWLAKEITGQNSPKPETVAESARRKKKEKGIIGKVKGTYSAVENSIQSWEHLLDRIAIKSGKKIFRSKAVTEFGSMAHAGQRNAEMYNRETADAMLKNGLKIFGAKKGRALTRKLQKLSKKTGEIRVKGDTLQLSPLEAAYLYNVRKESGTEPVFKKMGFTTESFSDMDALMTPELKAWADYLHGDLLAKALQGETEAYQDVNGVTRTPEGLFREGQTEIPIMNLNSAVMNRVSDANHYRAWAVPSKTFNDVFSSPEIRGHIEQHAGANTLQALDRFLEDFAKSPRELRGDQAWMDKLRSNVVMSMIGANPTTFFKQLTSIPAYAADIPVTAFVGNFAHGLANFRGVKRLIDSSVMAKERFGTGFDRDIHEASKATAEQAIGGKVTRVRDVLMSMTKLGDRAAIYAGYTVYKYHNDKALSQGKSPKEAHDIGILEFEKATERTQQAAGVKDRGSFERGGSLQKLFTMYMTSPAAYTRQTMAAVRHFKTDPIGSSKRLLIFNVMLPMMFQAVASGFLGVGGEDEDKTEEFWKKELRAVALGPFMGIPIARDLAAGTWESMMGSWYGPDPGFSPVTEVSKSLTQAIFYASKGLREGDKKAIEKAKEEFFDFLGYMAGLPTKPGKRLWEGWADLASGETEHQVMAGIGMSRSARKEKHLNK